jgi:membrane associated rhomboid family serine protease
MKKLFNRITPAVKYLFLINVSIYSILLMLDLFLNISIIDINDRLGAFCYVSENFNIYQLITYMFMHDAVPLHIGINMLFFLLFAPNFERTFGTELTIISYFFFGITSFLCFNFAINQENVLLIGSSGSIIGFSIIFLIMNFLKFQKIIYNLLVVILLIELIAIFEYENFYNSITGYGHLGGIFGGIIIYSFLKLLQLKRAKI